MTASNSGGFVSATSLQTTVVSGPAGPTAAFGATPASPQTGQNVQFDASGSTCLATPCTYSWADVPPSGGSWALGTGQTLDYTFTGAGTKYVTLTVTDALNQIDSVEHGVVVRTPTVSAPTNTAAPVVSGTPQTGQTLTASTGTWSGAPTSYAYQWRDCDPSGGNCSDIGGATGVSYQLVAGDVGHTVRVVVTATNSGGSASQSSAPGATVTSGSPGSGTQTSTCFPSPGACGFPDPAFGNVGVPAGTQLTNSGTINVTTDGTVIDSKAVTGEIDIHAPNGSTITVKNTRVTNTGGGCGTTSTCGNADIHSYCNCTVNISHVELTTDTSTTVEHAIRNSYGGTLHIDHVWASGDGTGCSASVSAGQVCGRYGADALCWCGNATISDSYALVPKRIGNDHIEDTYSDGHTLTIDHSVLLNPTGQTANIFANTGGGSGGACSNHLTVTDNLLAGGGFTIYACANSSSVGSSSLDFENNRISRGYFPNAGQYGIHSGTYCPPANGNTWDGNVWDDTNAKIAC